MPAICRPGLTSFVVEMKTSRVIDPKKGYCIHHSRTTAPLALNPPIRNSINTHLNHTNIFFSVSGLGFIFAVQNQFSFAQKNLQDIKKACLKSQQRDIMGIISQTCQGRTVHWSLSKKAKKFPKDYLELVSHFGKEFLVSIGSVN